MIIFNIFVYFILSGTDVGLASKHVLQRKLSYKLCYKILDKLAICLANCYVLFSLKTEYLTVGFANNFYWKYAIYESC